MKAVEGASETDFITVQDAFLAALEQVSELQPELEIRIGRKIRENQLFFYATGFQANELLYHAIRKRQQAGISTNIFIHGEQGTQVGKTFTALIIASDTDPKFTIDNLFFDFTELEQKLPETLPQTTYVVDDVRNRLGTGSKAEEIGVTNFLETSSVTGTSLILCSPTIKTLSGIHYIILMLGFCAEFALGILYDRTGDPVGWLLFVIPEKLQPLIQEYKVREKAYKQGIREKSGARGGYVSAKIAQLIQDIKERGLQFPNKKKLWRFITLEYDHWVQEVRRAAYEEVKEILFGENNAEKPVPVEVRQGQPFFDFLEKSVHNTTTLSIIKHYQHPNTIREVAQKIGFSIGYISECKKELVQSFLGDFYEIWYNKGGSPAPEGKVDAWEQGFPTNLKATYQASAKLRIPAEKLMPEINLALEYKSKFRIRAYNLYYRQEIAQDFDPQEVLRNGSATVQFSPNERQA